MSVTCAPRARMAEKAACPGVSRNVAVPCMAALLVKGLRLISQLRFHKCGPQVSLDSKSALLVNCLSGRPLNAALSCSGGAQRCKGAAARLGLTLDPGRETENAPICCVMPPASPAATAVLRRASSRDVWQPQTCINLSMTTGCHYR